MRSCFVSAPVNVDLSKLKSILASKGIEVILPFELEITGANFKSQIDDAIRKADFHVAVLRSGGGNENVYFELGYAWSKRKRTLLIQERGLILPPDLAGFPSLKVDFDDLSSLPSFLDQFLANEPPQKDRAVVESKTKPLSMQASRLREDLKVLGTKASSQKFERLISGALRSSGVVVVEPQGQSVKQAQEFQYDLALWVDEIQHLVGNPLMVELKTRLSVGKAKELKVGFLKRFNLEVGRALVVVYLDGKEERIDKESWGAPLVIFVSASRLLAELENESFGEFVRRERNRLVHGI